MSNTNLNKYDRYIKGNMSEKELDQFTKKILQEHQQNEALKDKWKSLLKEEHNVSYKEIEEENRGKVISMAPPQKSRSRILRLAGALAVAASVVFAALFFLPQGSSNAALSAVEQKLEEHYANISVSRSVLKGGDSPVSAQREQAFAQYEQKNYVAAIPLFKEVSQSADATEEDTYFLGLSYLYNEQAPEAAKVFEQMLQSDNSERADIVPWYLALALISSGECDKAKTQLQTVSQLTGNKAKRTLATDAKELLELVEQEGCPVK